MCSEEETKALDDPDSHRGLWVGYVSGLTAVWPVHHRVEGSTGMVRVRGGRVDGTFAAYMNPGEPLGSWAQTNLKNSVGDALTNEWLQTQRHCSEVLPESLVFLGSARIVGGHNVAFDIQVMRD